MTSYRESAAESAAEPVDETEVGAAVIRMQANTADMSDVNAVCNMVVKSAQFRQRCSVLGAMARHLTDRQREENAEAMCSVIFERLMPAESTVPYDSEDPPDWREVTARWIVQCSPMQGSKWEPHFGAVEWAKSTAMKSCRLSPYAEEVVRSVEEMWGLSNHLLVSKS